MADALVSMALEKLSNVAREQLGNAAKEQVALFAGAADELEKLKNTFQSIQAFLVDAESRQVGEESACLWLSRLRAASYDIADVLDEWETISSVDDQQDESSSRSWIASKVCECFLYLYDCMDYVVSRQQVSWSIKEIRKRLHQIADEKNKYGFSSISVVGVQNKMPVGARIERVTTSVLDEPEMIMGREDEKETMISRLLGESSSSCQRQGQGQVDVVGIVGIGGLGKTTLVRQIYHDSRVQGYFDKRLWVCVSTVLDVIRLIKAILEQVKWERTSLSDLESLKIELGESLRGKRFLLVLDDVWIDDARKWKELGLTLSKSGACGSRILVTTRSNNVAKIMKATFVHDLQGLSDDVSWKLFRSEAWKEGEAYPELESVGREIVNKCKGVPLSIKVIGGAMHSMRTLEDWNNVLNSRIWSLPKAAGEIMPALVLTYSYLPTHLKECFAYCSMFPKDTLLDKGLLVRLWVTQGFIRSQRQREIEDIGAEYFDELVARSLFHEVEKNSDGEITSKMHDLVRDLAEFIMKDEIHTFDTSNSDGEKSNQCPSINGNARHAHFTLSGIVENNRISFDGAKKLRTFILEADFENANFDSLSQARFLRALYIPNSTSWSKGILRLKHLRYLNISGSDIVELPKATGEMKQLMYLDLSFTGISELPESVILLQSLLALNLNWCSELKKLPRGMGRMVSLRHLEMRGTDSLECLPAGLCKITSLRTLSKFIVGGEGGGCGIEELQPLNSLEGSLEIVNLEKVSSREEAENAQLYKKSRLRRLVLSMSEDAEREGMEGVLEGLKPHSKLEEVELYGYPCSRLPSWMELMPCLRKLLLSSCPELEWVRLRLPELQDLQITSADILESLPEALGQLRKLKKLSMAHLTALTHLPDSIGQLKSLQSLLISECYALRSLPDSIGQLESLQHLEITRCYALGSLPHGLQHLSLLQLLEIEECPLLSKRCKRGEGVYWPNISHIPAVSIDYETL